MSWEKDSKGRFSGLQRSKILRMSLRGWKAPKIAQHVGASNSTIYSIIEAEKKKGTKPSNGGLKKQKPPIDLPTVVESDGKDSGYLLWALSGALRKVGNQNFVDRLIEDIQEGRFG